MKIRLNYVSNSSSTSFILNDCYTVREVAEKILDDFAKICEVNIKEMKKKLRLLSPNDPVIFTDQNDKTCIMKKDGYIFVDTYRYTHWWDVFPEEDFCDLSEREARTVLGYKIEDGSEEFAETFFLDDNFKFNNIDIRQRKRRKKND